MIQKRVANPFKVGPQIDPVPCPDGVIRPAPHAHVSPVAEVFETIQQAMAEARAGDPLLLMSAWMHLTPACFTGGQLALVRRALIELSSRIKLRMTQFLTEDRPVSIPDWAAAVFRDTDGNVAHETIEQAFLDDYRSFGLRFIAEQPVDTHQTALNGLLAVALVTAYIDADELSADALLTEDTETEQVMLALMQIHNAVIAVIADIEEIPFEHAARSFDNRHLL